MDGIIISRTDTRPLKWRNFNE